jgi:hypothetical protein
MRTFAGASQGGVSSLRPARLHHHRSFPTLVCAENRFRQAAHLQRRRWSLTPSNHLSLGNDFSPLQGSFCDRLRPRSRRGRAFCSGVERLRVVVAPTGDRVGNHWTSLPLDPRVDSPLISSSGSCEVNGYRLRCLRDPSTLCYTVVSFLTAALLASRIRSEFLDSPAFRC